MCLRSDDLIPFQCVTGQNIPHDDGSRRKCSPNGSRNIFLSKFIAYIIAINFVLLSCCCCVYCLSAQNDKENILQKEMEKVEADGDEEKVATMTLKNGYQQNLDSIEKPETEVFSFLATKEQDIPYVSLYEQPCHPSGYKEEDKINAKPERCGVAFLDNLVDSKDMVKLREMAIKLIDQLGETTITNRESHNLQWLNLHTIFRKAKLNLFTENDYELLVNTSRTAKSIVSLSFGIPEDKLFFTTVCQFTQYQPVTKFSEFRHIDKVRSPELIVTSILWLSTVDEDFGGGRLEFLNGPGNGIHEPILIEPKRGRYAAWTSSFENPHGVHELLYGQRLALIFAFTAKPNFGHSSIEDLRTWAFTKKPSFYY